MQIGGLEYLHLCSQNVKLNHEHTDLGVKITWVREIHQQS